MRKKTIVLGVIELIMLIYVCIAYRSIRGLHIFLLSYELGKVFVYTYIPVAFFATIGIVFVIRLVKYDIMTLKKNKIRNDTIKVEKEKRKISIDKSAQSDETTILLQADEQKETIFLTQEEPEEETELIIKMETVDEQEKNTVIKSICYQCGNEVKTNQKFCIKCGNKLTWEKV